MAIQQCHLFVINVANCNYIMTLVQELCVTLGKYQKRNKMIVTKTLKVPPVLQLRHIRNIGSALLYLFEVAVNKALQTLPKSLNLAKQLLAFVFQSCNRIKHKTTPRPPIPNLATTQLKYQRLHYHQQKQIIVIYSHNPP